MYFFLSIVEKKRDYLPASIKYFPSLPISFFFPLFLTELRELVTLHAEPDRDGGESLLSAEEVSVIHGALDMAHKTAETAMTPLANVYSLDADAVLDRKLLESIISAGHSRIPVYEGTDTRNIIGLILVKLLILRDTTKPVRVRDCLLREVDFIVADTPLYYVMELFRLKRRHMAVLTRSAGELDQELDQEEPAALPTYYTCTGKPLSPLEVTSNTATIGNGREKSGDKKNGRESSQGLLNIPTHPPTTRPPSAGFAGGFGDVIGILTLEDIFEELLSIEIADETDQYIDNEKTIEVSPLKVDLPPRLSRYLSWGRKQGHHAPLGSNTTQLGLYNGQEQEPWVRASPTQQFALGGGSIVGTTIEHNNAVIAAAAGAAFAAVKQNNAHQRRVQSETKLAGTAASGAVLDVDASVKNVTAHPLQLPPLSPPSSPEFSAVTTFEERKKSKK